MVKNKRALTQALLKNIEEDEEEALNKSAIEIISISAPDGIEPRKVGRPPKRKSNEMQFDKEKVAKAKKANEEDIIESYMQAFKEQHEHKLNNYFRILSDNILATKNEIKDSIEKLQLTAQKVKQQHS
jgi:hypothetical protein